MLRLVRISAFSLLLLLTLAGSADRPPIDAARLQADVEFLASAEMRGRGTGTPENDRAAEYIAAEFRRAGLEPLFGDSYFQPFTVTVGAELGADNAVHATFAGNTAELEPGRDFLPLSFSDSGRATLPAAFAGYGITAPEYSWDDYAHFDAAGKAVIVLRHEPRENDDTSPFAGRQLTTHSEVVSKAINARLHGARAMILVNDPLPHPDEEDALIRFGSLAGPENAGLLVLHARREVVDRWLAAAGRGSLEQLQRALDEGMQPQSFPLAGVTLDLRVEVKKAVATTRNVGGILRGNDPRLAGEAVLVGAHFDHLGLGGRSSLAPDQTGQVHPGADDNASGTAAVLELARALGPQRNPRGVRRSVIFLGFSGEELGLLGSAHYTRHPAWPLERTAAMLNLDMVGRPRDNKLYVGGVGTSPVFKELLERANTVGLELAPSESGYGSSDHTSFYVKDIPVLFFFSGLHADYHKPSDTPDRIQHADHARVAALAYSTVTALAALDERPQFVRVREPERPAAGGGPGYGAYFGSIPDMGEEVEGVRFADVRDGSPAALAGLRAGDILVEFGGKAVKNLYDFTYALRAHRPGEEVQVTVLRGGERLTVKVKLTQRR